MPCLKNYIYHFVRSTTLRKGFARDDMVSVFYPWPAANANPEAFPYAFGLTTNDAALKLGQPSR